MNIGSSILMIFLISLALLIGLGVIGSQYAGLTEDFNQATLENDQFRTEVDRLNEQVAQVTRERDTAIVEIQNLKAEVQQKDQVILEERTVKEVALAEVARLQKLLVPGAQAANPQGFDVNSALQSLENWLAHLDWGLFAAVFLTFILTLALALVLQRAYSRFLDAQKPRPTPPYQRPVAGYPEMWVPTARFNGNGHKRQEPVGTPGPHQPGGPSRN